MRTVQDTIRDLEVAGRELYAKNDKLRAKVEALQAERDEAREAERQLTLALEDMGERFTALASLRADRELAWDQSRMEANRLRAQVSDLSARLGRQQEEKSNRMIQALKNVGVDDTCGTCMEIALTGCSTGNPHTCVEPPGVSPESSK